METPSKRRRVDDTSTQLCAGLFDCSLYDDGYIRINADHAALERQFLERGDALPILHTLFDGMAARVMQLYLSSWKRRHEDVVKPFRTSMDDDRGVWLLYKHHKAGCQTIRRLELPGYELPMSGALNPNLGELFGRKTTPTIVFDTPSRAAEDSDITCLLHWREGSVLAYFLHLECEAITKQFEVTRSTNLIGLVPTLVRLMSRYRLIVPVEYTTAEHIDLSKPTNYRLGNVNYTLVDTMTGQEDHCSKFRSIPMSNIEIPPFTA